jgi:serine/threonine protein kinase
MSPRKGLFFGSRFYSHLEKALEHYDIRLKDITPEEKQRYYKALADTVKTEPRFLGNDYILQSLSKEANITFPAVPPQIEEKTAIAYLENKRQLPPHSFKSQQSLYVMQQQPLGKGGWGTVHAARQYRRGSDGRLTSNIMVLKKMPKAHASIAQKEITMYKRANPKLEGECLTESNHIYMAMPFYPGAPLDSFLQNETGSDIEARKQMVDALLKDLAPIHRQDVIHCDIKPKNILWDPVRKKMHIVDFGCAEENNAVAKYTDLGNAKFAIEYMPPEYVTGSVNISKPMDIYSLTLTVAEILGADKTALVRRKLEAALTTPDISDPQKEAIRRAFTQLGSLDKALFSSDVNQCLDGNAYKTFIQAYSAQQYDLSPYVEAFGEDVVNMLNRMQTLEPGRRPSIEDIQKLFQQPNLDEQERMEKR